MRCPFCDVNNDRVVDSRESKDGATIRRRRECLDCKRRFTSYEQIEHVPYMVVKQDGRREEFSRTKLLAGLIRAAQKRSIPIKKLEEIADAAEGLVQQKEEREIDTQDIGSFVMEQLRDLDQVAYVRFASVYRRFDDIDAFMDELKHMVQTERSHPTAGRRQRRSTTSGPSTDEANE